MRTWVCIVALLRALRSSPTAMDERTPVETETAARARVAVYSNMVLANCRAALGNRSVKANGRDAIVRRSQCPSITIPIREDAPS